MPRTTREIIDLYRNDRGQLTPGEEAAKPADPPAEETMSGETIARELKVSPSQISRWANNQGLPRKKIKGQWRYRLAEVRAWIAANVATRGKYSTGAGTQASTAPAAPLSASDNRLIDDLRSGERSSVQMMRITRQMAANRVADAYAARALNTPTLEGFRKASEELRKAEQAEMELQVACGKLMPIETAREYFGVATAAAVRICETICNAIVAEVMIWKTMDVPADELKRIVRAFVQKHTAEVRRLEAEGIEALIGKAE